MTEDIGEKAISMLKELEIKLEKKVKQQEQNKKQSISEGKKNSHIHLLIETNLKERLREEAEKEGMFLSELCRRKLRESSQLDRIERMLTTIISRKKR